MSPAEATVTYKWMQSSTKTKADGYLPIEGATEKTYVLTNSEVGKYVLCEVTGTGKYSGTVRSEPTSAVKAKPIPVTSVSISGTAKVGETLTAAVEPGGATVTYEWSSADSADGAYSPIGDQTAATLALAETQLNKFIKVKVIGTGNYTGTAESAATAQVAAASP